MSVSDDRFALVHICLEWLLVGCMDVLRAPHPGHNAIPTFNRLPVLFSVT